MAVRTPNPKPFETAAAACFSAPFNIFLFSFSNYAQPRRLIVRYNVTQLLLNRLLTSSTPLRLISCF